MLNMRLFRLIPIGKMVILPSSPSYDSQEKLLPREELLYYTYMQHEEMLILQGNFPLGFQSDFEMDGVNAGISLLKPP